MMPVVRSVTLPFVRVEYDRAAPSHSGGAVTRAGSIGVAFTRQSKAVWELAGRTVEGEFPAAVSLTGSGDMVWLRWSDVSEAIEFWLDEAWLQRICGCRGMMMSLAPRISIDEPVLYGIASAFRRAMVSDAIDPLEFEGLAIAAARRVAPVSSLATDRSGCVAPLDDRRLRLIDEFVEANLDRQITLEALANLTSVSIFHLAKRFKAATGTSVYAHVVGRKMNQAMQLLRTGEWTVASVAHAVGYSQVGHFRRQFLAHWGQLPGRLEK